jgi:hypothetical protein
MTTIVFSYVAFSASILVLPWEDLTMTTKLLGGLDKGGEGTCRRGVTGDELASV